MPSASITFVACDVSASVSTCGMSPRPRSDEQASNTLVIHFAVSIWTIADGRPSMGRDVLTLTYPAPLCAAAFAASAIAPGILRQGRARARANICDRRARAPKPGSSYLVPVRRPVDSDVGEHKTSAAMHRGVEPVRCSFKAPNVTVKSNCGTSLKHAPLSLAAPLGTSQATLIIASSKRRRSL